MRRAFLWVSLITSTALAGCNTDAAVFVDPAIESPTLTVTKGLLGTSVKGSFTLTLHLGARASGASDVSEPVMKIQDAKGESAITEITAQLSSGATQFPVHVEQDSDVDVAMTFDSGADPIPSDLTTKLCDAAGITIGGSVRDSLQGSATPVDSAVFHASGCM